MNPSESTVESSTIGKPAPEKTKFPSKLPVNPTPSSRKRRKTNHSSAEYDATSDTVPAEPTKGHDLDDDGRFWRTEINWYDGKNPEESVVYMIPSNQIPEEIFSGLRHMSGTVIEIADMDPKTEKKVIPVGEFLEANRQFKTPMFGSGIKSVENASVNNIYRFVMYEDDRYV